MFFVEKKSPICVIFFALGGLTKSCIKFSSSSSDSCRQRVVCVSVKKTWWSEHRSTMLQASAVPSTSTTTPHRLRLVSFVCLSVSHLGLFSHLFSYL